MAHNCYYEAGSVYQGDPCPEEFNGEALVAESDDSDDVLVTTPDPDKEAFVIAAILGAVLLVGMVIDKTRK